MMARLRSVLTNTWVRVGLSLGIVASLAATTTFAYWSDQVVMTGGTFTSGTLQLKIDGNNPTYNNTSMTMADMLPGESRATAINVQNTGDAPFTYTGKVKIASSTYTGTPLTVRAYAGSVNDNTGSYPRTGTCNGSAAGAELTITGTDQNIFTSARTLAPGNENICLLVKLDPATANANQSKTATFTFTFDADQVVP